MIEMSTTRWENKKNNNKANVNNKDLLLVFTSEVSCCGWGCCCGPVAKWPCCSPAFILRRTHGKHFPAFHPPLSFKISRENFYCCHCLGCGGREGRHYRRGSEYRRTCGPGAAAAPQDLGKIAGRRRSRANFPPGGSRGGGVLEKHFQTGGPRRGGQAT